MHVQILKIRDVQGDVLLRLNEMKKNFYLYVGMFYTIFGIRISLSNVRLLDSLVTKFIHLFNIFILINREMAFI